MKTISLFGLLFIGLIFPPNRQMPVEKATYTFISTGQLKNQRLSHIPFIKFFNSFPVPYNESIKKFEPSACVISIPEKFQKQSPHRISSSILPGLSKYHSTRYHLLI